MNQEISQTTASCELCLTYRPKQQAEPLMPHPVPNRPYYKIVKGLMKKAHDGKEDFLKKSDDLPQRTAAERTFTCTNVDGKSHQNQPTHP
jgi:hypothetical protein